MADEEPEEQLIGEPMEVNYSDRPDHVRYDVNRRMAPSAFWSVLAFHGGMAARQIAGSPEAWIELACEDWAEAREGCFTLLFTKPGVVLSSPNN